MARRVLQSPRGEAARNFRRQGFEDVGVTAARSREWFVLEVLVVGNGCPRSTALHREPVPLKTLAIARKVRIVAAEALLLLTALAVEILHRCCCAVVRRGGHFDAVRSSRGGGVLSGDYSLGRIWNLVVARDSRSHDSGEFG